jgi:putative CGCGG family rSAM target protein
MGRPAGETAAGEVGAIDPAAEGTAGVGANIFAVSVTRRGNECRRMTTETTTDAVTDVDEEAHDLDAAPVTDRVHDNSWSANLEGPEHAESRSLVVEQAVSAVEHTASGNHVNLVTHGDHGHPETYLYDALDDAYGDDVEWEYVDRCGCGGHVVRVRT